jgi:hypothetical protein
MGQLITLIFVSLWLYQLGMRGWQAYQAWDADRKRNQPAKPAPQAQANRPPEVSQPGEWEVIGNSERADVTKVFTEMFRSYADGAKRTAGEWERMVLRFAYYGLLVLLLLAVAVLLPVWWLTAG